MSADCCPVRLKGDRLIFYNYPLETSKNRIMSETSEIKTKSAYKYSQKIERKTATKAKNKIR
jgi:hypothetical protein